VAIVRGQKSNESDANTSTPATSWTTAPAAGSKVIVWLWGSSTATPTMSDNGSPSRTFTLAASKTDATNTLGIWIFYGDDVRPSGTYTVTATFGAANSFSIGGLAYTGVVAGGPEATNNNTGTGTSVSSGAVTGTGAEDLYAGGFVDNANGPDTITTGGGFTEEFELADGTTFDEGGGADKIGVTGSQTASWTLTNSRTWSSCIACWLAQSVGGLGSIRPGLTWQRYYWKGIRHPWWRAAEPIVTAPAVSLVAGSSYPRNPNRNR